MNIICSSSSRFEKLAVVTIIAVNSGLGLSLPFVRILYVCCSSKGNVKQAATASTKRAANASDKTWFHWICASHESLQHLEKYIDMYVGLHEGLWIY